MHRGRALLGDDVTADDRETLTALGWTQLADCDVAEGLAIARLAIALSAGQADYQAAFAAEVLTAADELDEAAPALDESIELLRAAGHAPALAYAYQSLSEVELRHGDVGRALSLASQPVVLGEEASRWLPGWQLAQLAEVEAVLGLEAACRDHAARARSAGWGGESWSGAAADAALGLLELGLGNEHAALEALDRAHRVAGRYRHPGYVRYAADRIEAPVRLGERDRAVNALADLAGRAAAAGSPWARHAVARGHLLLAPAGELDTRYRQALAVPVCAFEEARTTLVYAERLRREGRRVEARERLQAALAAFEAAGAEAWARRARNELRASGARLRRREPDARDELTRQELQVALVVAEGVTNREAAARLFLSPKTIETHLSRAYRKLGVRTRTELARRLALAPRTETAGPAAAGSEGRPDRP